MKKFLIAAAIAGLSISAAAAQPASGGNVCLQANMIDHTHTVDANTVLFYMRGGKVWKNTLAGPCPGLALSGFEVTGHQDEICGSGTGITVIKSGAACRLGEFTPYAPPAH